MKIKKSFSNLLSTEMNRKDFLKLSGATLLFVSGGGIILQSVNRMRQLQDEHADARPSFASGKQYGAMKYGGSQAGM